jgi:hypothetical protein
MFRTSVYGCCVRLIAALTAVALLSSCGDESSSPYALNVNVTGLSGSGLQVTLNGGAPISISANSQTTIAHLTNGTAYTVTINAQPVSPLQICTASNPSGKIAGNNVDVTINCVAAAPGTIIVAQATVAIDSSVPSSAIDNISGIASPVDAQKLGVSLYVPYGAGGGESMVVAVDSSNNIVLASLLTTTSVSLSAGSTALALTRLEIGALPSTAVAGQLNAAIQATSEFPNLVAVISAALNANKSPVTSGAVYSSIGTVLTQLPETVVTALQSLKSASEHAQAGPVASPSVTTSLPYELVNFSTKLSQTVAVTGAEAETGYVQVSNSTLIAWSLASATTSGQKLCLPNTAPSANNPDCSVVVPQTDLLHDLGTVVASNAISTGTVAGDGGGSFNLILEQNYLSHYTNVLQIGLDLVGTIEFFSSGEESPSLKSCLKSFAETLLPAEKVATLAANPTAAALESYFDDELSSVSLVKTILACGSALFPSSSAGSWNFAQAVTAFAFGLSNFALNAVSGAATAAGLPAEIYWTVSYWPYGKDTFGVCEAQSPPPTLVISNCAQSFAFAPATAILVPGSSFTTGVGMPLTGGVTPTLSAYLGAAGSGGTTLVPPDLIYSSPQDGSAIDLNAQTGTVDAIALLAGQTTAQAIVTVTETSTGISASYTVNVDSIPTMSLAASLLSLPASGGPVTLTAALGPPTGALGNPPTPIGTVRFSDPSGTLCEMVAMNSGVATCPATIASAPDNVTATYSGDSNYSTVSQSLIIALTSSGGGRNFTYTGSTFDTTDGLTGPVSATVTFAAAIPANYTGSVPGSQMATVTISTPGINGPLSPTTSDTSQNFLSFNNGQVSAWYIGASQSNPGGCQYYDLNTGNYVQGTLVNSITTSSATFDSAGSACYDNVGDLEQPISAGLGGNGVWTAN